jgi:hypothetical protein
MSMALDEIDELTDEVSPEHVARRVQDWRERIANLHATLRRWLPRGWTAESTPAPSAMNEALMREHGVAPVRLDWLKIHGPDGQYWVLIPRALWTVGANGGLVLQTEKRAYLVLDQAPAFTSPEWVIAENDYKSSSRPLDEGVFTGLLLDR